MPDQNVYVVDDDPAVRKAVVFLVESAGLNVVGFTSANDFLESCDSDVRGCLVLDVRMPGLSGLELQESLAERGIGIPIVFITGHGSVSMSVRALKKGAIDFIEKPFNDTHLLDSISRALDLDLQSRDVLVQRRRYAQRLATLTHREREILGYLLAGKHTKQIATELDISIKTVDKHRARVLEKMQAESTVGLLRLAYALDTSCNRAS